jgi:hypothetical protein
VRTHVEQGHVCGQPFRLVLVEDGAGVVSVISREVYNLRVYMIAFCVVGGKAKVHTPSCYITDTRYWTAEASDPYPGL